MRTLTAILAITILGCPADWDENAFGGCPKVFVKKQAVVLQAYAYPVIQQYQVGAAVQQEAVIEAAVARAFAKLAATVTTQQTTTTTQANISSQAQSHVGGQTQAQAQIQSVGQFQRCARCHTGPNRTGFRVDVDLSCEDRLLAISMLLHDDPARRMPRGATLPADELGLLIQAFSAGIPAPSQVRIQQAPPPEPVPLPPGPPPGRDRVPPPERTPLPPEPMPPAPGTQQ